MKVLVAGSAGFIGSHLCQKLMLNSNLELIAVDNFDPYYSPEYKKKRFSFLCKGLELLNLNLNKLDLVQDLIEQKKPDICINLAAVPGVRASIKFPYKYLSNNTGVQLNFLEVFRKMKIRPRFIYASSSSVYHKNDILSKRSEEELLGAPISFYAQSKKYCEEMSELYANTYEMNIFAMRFFTVYGPWGRPDMAYWSFLEKILSKQKIDLFGQGEMKRCYTYIDDVVQILENIILKKININGQEIFNIGCQQKISNKELLLYLEKKSGYNANFELKNNRCDENPSIIPDMKKSLDLLNYNPTTKFSDGIDKFVEWYLSYKKGY